MKTQTTSSTRTLIAVGLVTLMAAAAAVGFASLDGRPGWSLFGGAAVPGYGTPGYSTPGGYTAPGYFSPGGYHSLPGYIPGYGLSGKGLDGSKSFLQRTIDWFKG